MIFDPVTSRPACPTFTKSPVFILSTMFCIFPIGFRFTSSISLYISSRYGHPDFRFIRIRQIRAEVSGSSGNFAGRSGRLLRIRMNRRSGYPCMLLTHKMFAHGTFLMYQHSQTRQDTVSAGFASGFCLGIIISYKFWDRTL